MTIFCVTVLGGAPGPQAGRRRESTSRPVAEDVRFCIIDPMSWDV
jgi:hypothetical protein